MSRMSRLFSLVEKIYAPLLFIAGLNLRDVLERYGFTYA